MQLSKIIPLLAVFLIVGCSTPLPHIGGQSSDGNGNTGGVTQPSGIPQPDPNNPSMRRPLSFYTDLLDGEIQAELDRLPIIVPGGTAERSTERFRIESITPTFFHSVISTEGRPTRANLTNDLVEDIIFTTTPSGQRFLSYKKLITRRGSLSENVAKQSYSNDIIFAAVGNYRFLSIGTPTVSLQDQNGNVIELPEGFEVFLLPTPNSSAQVSRALSGTTDDTTLSPWGRNLDGVGNIRYIFIDSSNENSVRIIHAISIPRAIRYVDGVIHTYTRVE